MLLCALLAAVWFLTRNDNIISQFKQFYHHKTPLEIVAHEYQPRYVDGEFEQSFAGRTQKEIRSPFGPNPQQHNIIDQKFVDNHDFQQKYRLNLHQMFIENNDWRLDPTMNGPYHFYQDPHQPIKRLPQIIGFDGFSQDYDFNFQQLDKDQEF